MHRFPEGASFEEQVRYVVVTVRSFCTLCRAIEGLYGNAWAKAEREPIVKSMSFEWREAMMSTEKALVELRIDGESWGMNVLHSGGSVLSRIHSIESGKHEKWRKEASREEIQQDLKSYQRHQEVMRRCIEFADRTLLERTRSLVEQAAPQYLLASY